MSHKLGRGLGVNIKEHLVQYQSPGQEERPTIVDKVYNFLYHVVSFRETW